MARRSLRRYPIRPIVYRPRAQTPAGPPAFGDAGTQLQGTASTMNVDVPDNVAADDIIIVVAFVDTAAASITALASGFAHAPDSPVTVNPGGGGQSHTLNILWKRATGADSTAATYDFTLSGSVYRNARAFRYTNAVTSGSPWDVTASASDTTNGTASPAVSDTTTLDNTLLIWAATDWSANAAPSWTSPAGYSERFDVGDAVVTMADLAQPTQGSTGSVSGSNTGSGARTAWIGALKPVGVTGGDSRAQTGRSAGAAIATGSAVHVSAQSARAAAASAALAAQVKRATVAATATTGPAASGTVSHPATAAQSGRATVGATAAASAVKVAARSSRSAAATVASGAAVKKAPAAGASSVGVSATGAARKVTAQAGRSTAVALAFGSLSTGETRAQSGRATAGVAATAIGVRVARPAASATVAAAIRAAMVKRATPPSSSALGAAARATGARRSQPSGSTHAGVTASATVLKRAPVTASCTAGVLPLRVETSRAAIGRCHAGVAAWQRRTTTRRPEAAMIARPGSGVTARPYAGVTPRP